ncbi:response regulator transcription factor [Peptoniphilaceae bacterium SGI.131]
MLKMLIADDEKIIRQGLRDLVNSYNMNIRVLDLASDGMEVVDIARREEPEIILMDINMPKLDGLQAIALIREFIPNSKIIIISGYDDFKYAQKAIELGVSSYLLKPINYKEFRKILQSVCDAYSRDLLANNEGDKISATPIDYIKNNYMNSDLTLLLVARDLYMSTSYVAKYIKDRSGYNFTDYLNMYRLNISKKLMANQDLTFKEIADLVGYTSQHYFSRVFKNYFGVSPSDYRKSCLK